MKEYLILLLVLIQTTSCKSVKNYNEQITKKHTVENLQIDVTKLYHQIQSFHPKLYQYISKEELDYKFDSLQKTITEPLTSRELYLKLAPGVSEIRQGHLNISPPLKRYKNKELKLLKQRKWGFSKLNFEYVDDKLLLQNAKGKDSILNNSEVLEFDKDSVSTLIEKYKALITSDGFNRSFYNRFPGMAIKNFYLKKTGFKDSIRLTLKQNDSVFYKTFKRISKKEIEEKIPLSSLFK